MLLKSSNGVVVNHTSVGGSSTVPFQGVYNASKAAMVRISDTLRLELQPFRITVVDLRTAGVRSNFLRNIKEESPSLPTGSTYGPAKEVLEKVLRQEQFGSFGIPAQKWFKMVVHHLLKKDRPPVIWREDSAWLAWFATVLPFGTLDGYIKKLTRLDVIARILQK